MHYSETLTTHSCFKTFRVQAKIRLPDLFIATHSFDAPIPQFGLGSPVPDRIFAQIREKPAPVFRVPNPFGYVGCIAAENNPWRHLSGSKSPHVLALG